MSWVRRCRRQIGRATSISRLTLAAETLAARLAK
jgi:hypothetical protein